MKINSKKIWIPLSILAFLVAGFFFFFERVEVPDIKWDKTTDLNSENPNGYWLFKNLLEERFDQVNTLSPAKLNDSEASGSLFIYLNDDLFLYDEMDQIVSLAEQGNHFFISSYYLYTDSMPFQLNYEKGTEANQLIWDGPEGPDTISFYTDNLEAGNTLELHSATDILSNQYSATSKLNATLRHVLYNYKNRVTKDIENEIAISSCFTVGKGSICFHRVPYLFTNVCSRDDIYLDHFNSVFESYESTEANIIWPPSSFFNDNDSGRSPLRFILAQPGFKLAYYLILFSGFIYYIFGSKRKQKEIPLVIRKENTSLEFVDTMARLTQSRQRHNWIMVLIKDNFYQYVEQKLFIKETDDDFWLKVKRKTKISTEELATLKLAVQRINPLETWIDDDIIEIHQIFEDFYKKITHGRKQ